MKHARITLGGNVLAGGEICRINTTTSTRQQDGDDSNLFAVMALRVFQTRPQSH